MKLFPIVLASLLPMAAHAECAQRDVQGRWVLMAAVEDIGAWSRCNVRITSSGASTGSCVIQNGDVVTGEPGQVTVNPNCSVTIEGESGVATTSGRLQAGKRGFIGRFVYDDGQTFLEGPVLGVKR